MSAGHPRWWPGWSANMQRRAWHLPYWFWVAPASPGRCPWLRLGTQEPAAVLRSCPTTERHACLGALGWPTMWSSRTHVRPWGCRPQWRPPAARLTSRSSVSTAQGGTVVFFSMATNFAAAALGAEGLAADVRMLVGNGYVPGHADYAVSLLRGNSAVRRLFEDRLQTKQAEAP